VQLEIDNRLATRGAPLFAKPLHFSQLGHGRGYPRANREQSWRASPRERRLEQPRKPSGLGSNHSLRSGRVADSRVAKYMLADDAVTEYIRCGSRDPMYSQVHFPS
jgi:hypothetical protein